MEIVFYMEQYFARSFEKTLNTSILSELMLQALRLLKFVYFVTVFSCAKVTRGNTLDPLLLPITVARVRFRNLEDYKL